MLSGRNGTGKSLVLEAVLALWMNRYSWIERIGPWSDQCTVSIEVVLDQNELSQMSAWAAESRIATVDVDQNRVSSTLTVNKAGAVLAQYTDGAITVACDHEFQRQHQFTGVDYVPASRSVPLTGRPSVNLSVLDEATINSERINMLDQSIRDRVGLNLPHIATFLATLDYQSFLADRQNIVISDEYSRLADAFYRATGKVLKKPEYDGFDGANIRIRLPSGVSHELDGLSSGEQEMLALLYFVRRLSESGGVLCLDEPEQHLHPTLQAALFESIRDLSGRAQLLVVSHSVNLISTAPLSALIDVHAPMGNGLNQAHRSTNAPDRTRLIADLGITAASLLQSDMLLVVEGEEDIKRLHQMFPVEAGRLQFVNAGGGDRVVQMHDALSAVSPGIPWLCIRDRDFLNLEGVAGILGSRPNLLVWPYRELENHLLEPSLIGDLFSAIGRNTAIWQIENDLLEIAGPLFQETVAEFTNAAVRGAHPPPIVSATGRSRKERLIEEYRQYAAVNLARAEATDVLWSGVENEMKGRWKRDWRTLVDAKVVLKVYALKHSPFVSDGEFISALCSRVAANPSVAPLAVSDLRRIILARLNSSVEGGVGWPAA